MLENKEKKNGDFLLHGGILALAGILVRFIGMIYRVPMVNIIGSEGNGYYSNAYSVYNILLLISSYSLPLVVSKMVSSRVALKKWAETKRIFIVAFAFSTVVGVAFALITWFLAPFFCTTILNSPLSYIALRALAPTVAIVAFLGVFRGFFQGLQNMIPTALSQIIEQIFNAIFSVAMAAILVSFGASQAAENGVAAYKAAWGAAGGTIGTGVGALMALVFLVFLFVGYRKRLEKKVSADRTSKITSYGKLLGILAQTAVPVILATATYNAIDIIDASLFNHAMAGQNMIVEEYTAIWGDYNSAYLLLVHLPVALASAIGAALVPSLSSAFAQKDTETANKKVALTVRVTLLISIPCAFGMMAVGGNLAKLLFSNIHNEAQSYLVIGGMAVVFFSMATVTNAILQGLSHMERPVIHAFASLIGHVLLMLLLLFAFKLGVTGVIISYMLFGLALSVLNLIAIKKLTGYVIEPMHGLVIPTAISLVIVVFCVLFAFLFSKVLSGKVMHLVIVLVSLLVGVIIYAIGILKFGCITEEQLLEVPYGKKLVRLFKKLHLLKA